MNAEKASTLKLLREGIGNPVYVLDSRSDAGTHEVRAHLPGCSETGAIPVLFLITSLAFLEAKRGLPVDGAILPEMEDDRSGYDEGDGWTPADFLGHLRFEGRNLRLRLTEIRGRAIHTEVTLDETGELLIRTQGRGLSAQRWLSFVQGKPHLTQIG